ncbi:PREDICTED: uncharacterized protein LOC108769822 [Trachymyrmex cornetzi]|uniref:uncharacterized protein LOC108769822 n=1 Tax=Trachymyrmex cornetzi TaxID=471704 RepID=UPI00084EF3E9|nr:PREDICTED: uncharacterized protein LOC108769822 [Trachymyrmex cornetzi]
MAAVRQRFWPVSLRSAARKIINGCIPCFKAKPTHSEAIMGSLPAGRVTASKPFDHCGVAYAGPFTMRESKRRNARAHKAYLSLFVCFATKSVHLELVSNLTSESFIAAFKRFIWRRGKPVCMYSDNGTTFIGAQAQLKEFVNFLRDDQTQSDIVQFLREQETTWKFIPPNAPHFGGLEDPNDLICLTPGHFLIGTPLNSFPCHDLTNERFKWKTNKGNQLKPNQMVLLKQQGLAPLQWLLGRVAEVHPGSDGVVRAATIRTAKGLLTRPLSKIAVLPVDT